ncbi:MAG: hypothetical protein GVY24_04520 [Planctomycetes bacterium]|jgi:hypothetical protein|nr:hypothetical protein [Planctomycetota bacterium]
MPLRLERLPGNPIINPQTPGYDATTLGDNINGPSLIRAPDWLPDALGRYYLYFAHHQGTHVRLAYADDLAGPWTIHGPGTLTLDQTPFAAHIASPDLHVDHDQRRLRMYYHGCGGVETPWGIEQPTMLAFSADGLHWRTNTELLGESYFRVLTVGDGWTYAVAKGGRLYRSADGITGFTMRSRRLDYSARHWAVRVGADRIDWFYSRWGDQPEHLLHAITPLPADWEQWRVQDRYSLLRPEHAWEGADQPIAVSLPGSVHEPVHELRDPAYFRDDDGREYLLYTTAGESGIALARLIEEA